MKCDNNITRNVDNTADIDKPISTATQTALNCKQDNISDLNTIRNNACAGKTANDIISWYWDVVSCNASCFATAEQWWKADTAIQAEDLSTVATSGKYCDLSWTPSLSAVATSGCYSDLSWTPNLCAVATSGCYSDLSWTPNLCSVATSGKYCDLTWTPTIPTDNCQLANSCWFVTNAVNDLTNYYLKSETYQKCEVDNLIANFWWFEVVSVLPTTNIKTNVIYLKWPIWTGTDRYEEWIYYNNTWTLIWETSTDLSNYAKCCDIPTDNCQLWNSCWYITWISWSDVTDALWYTPYNSTNPNWYTSCTGTVVSSDLAPYAKSCDLCTVATTWSYNDLTDKLTAGTWINITNWAINSNWMTILSYWNSTWSDFETAYNNKMVVYARASSNSNPATWSQTRLAFMAYVNNADNPTEVEFQYYRSVNAHCDALQWDQVFVYKLTKTSWWSVTTRNAFSKIVAGSWLSSSYSNCCLTLCLDKWVNDLTNYTLSSNLSTVATSGCYNDLSGLPTIPTDNCQLSNGCNYITKDVNNLTNYTPTSSLATVATSWAYCDLSWRPTLACVATSWCYDDLSGKPNLWVYQTTANMVCTLSWADHSHYPSAKTVADALSCAWAWDMLSTVYDPNSKQADAFDYCNFINTPLLCAVATSWKYCDLSWLPTIPAALSAGNGICINNNCINVLCDNSTIKKNSNNTLYADFSWLATTASLCPVATSWQYCDLSWQPTIPTDNCQLANSCWYTTCTGTVVSSDLNAYAKSCDLATVATSWQYCDLIWTPTIPATLSSWTGICIDSDNKINAKNHYVVNEDAYDVTYTWTKWVSPYNTSYCYTNVCINPNCWIKWEEGATYMFNVNTKVATSACRNVRLKIWDGDYIPLVSTTTAVAWSSYFVKSSIRPFQYSTKYIAWWALHLITDSNTTYSAISQTEIDAGTATTWRLIGAANLKYAIKKYSPTDNCELANGCWYVTSSALSWYAQTCDLAAVATSWCYCDLTGTPPVPTDNCQLANGCWYTTCTWTLVPSDLNGYATTASLCTVATSGKYCDLTGSPTLCTVATSGKYCDLTWTPTIPTNNNQLTNGCGYTTCTGTVVASDLNAYAKTCTLCTVATSGKYCDLTGTPTIPTNNNQLTNWCWYTTCTWTISNCAWIISALWYTPYNATNPSWYTTCTGTLTQSAISDDAFGNWWDWDTTHAPSKNAIYDVLWWVEQLLEAL